MCQPLWKLPSLPSKSKTKKKNNHHLSQDVDPPREDVIFEPKKVSDNGNFSQCFNNLGIRKPPPVTSINGPFSQQSLDVKSL